MEPTTTECAADAKAGTGPWLAIGVKAGSCFAALSTSITGIRLRLRPLVTLSLALLALSLPARAAAATGDVDRVRMLALARLSHSGGGGSEARFNGTVAIGKLHSSHVAPLYADGNAESRSSTAPTRTLTASRAASATTMMSAGSESAGEQRM